MPIPGKIFSLLRGSHYAVEATIGRKFHGLIFTIGERCFSNLNGCLGTTRKTELRQLNCSVCDDCTPSSSRFYLSPPFLTPREKLRLDIIRTKEAGTQSCGAGAPARGQVLSTSIHGHLARTNRDQRPHGDEISRFFF